MDKNEIAKFEGYAKILVPAQSYRTDEDNRLLIPYTSGPEIGFINKDREIVVKPQYMMYYGECYSQDDYVRVAVIHEYGFHRSGGKVAVYNRPMYGLIDYKGRVIFETSYFSIVPNMGNKKLFTVQDKEYRYAVLDVDGNEIVPYGKYGWIDGFDKGVARVKSGRMTNGACDNGSKWGLIDERGREVLPLEYDNIWNFYGKKRFSTKVVCGDSENEIYFADLFRNDDVEMQGNSALCQGESDCGTHYGEYVGTYAQDVAGYSDDVIDDAFDGDPDAYWNID